MFLVPLFGQHCSFSFPRNEQEEKRQDLKNRENNKTEERKTPASLGSLMRSPIGSKLPKIGYQLNSVSLAQFFKITF